MRYRCTLLLTTVIVFSPHAALRGQNANDLEQRGIDAFKAGQLRTAERLFSTLVTEDPSGPAYSYLAATEGALGEYSQAITHFRKSIQLGSDTPGVRYNLALAYLKNNQTEFGIRELRASIAGNPKFTLARYALGVALLDAGKPRDALVYLEQVRSQSPDNPALWANLVRAELEAGNARQAIETIGKAIEVRPDDSRLPVTLAGLCLRYGQPQEARDLLENATEAAPQDAKLKVMLAQASLKAEEPQEALAVLKNLPASAAAPGELPFLQGSAFMLEGKFKEAAPRIAAAVAANPRDVDYISTYAELQTSERDFDGALASLKKAEQMRPNYPGFPYQTALIYIFMHRDADAAAACERATRLAPTFDQAYFLLGAIQFDQGEFRAAENAFQRAEAIKPASALYHSAVGAALFKTGRAREGRDELDHALLLDPHTVSAYFWRARVFASQNQPSKAIADLETFVALDSGYPDAYEQLARLYTAQGEYEKASAARTQYAALKQKIGPSPVPFFLSQLGSTRFRQTRRQAQ